MTVPAMIPDLTRIDEPNAAQGFSDVLTQVAVDGKTRIVCRDGKDLAAVISIEQLDRVREVFAQQEAERLAAKIRWKQASPSLQPPQEWFDGTDNPFESDE